MKCIVCLFPRGKGGGRDNTIDDLMLKKSRSFRLAELVFMYVMATAVRVVSCIYMCVLPAGLCRGR